MCAMKSYCVDYLLSSFPENLSFPETIIKQHKQCSVHNPY